MTHDRGRAWDDDDDDAWDDDDEAPDDDSDAEPTVPCPYCREEILEEAPRCPACGNFISAEDHAGPGKPAWVIVTALICLGMAIWWAFASG
jgi:hypothetical protein